MRKLIFVFLFALPLIQVKSQVLDSIRCDDLPSQSEMNECERLRYEKLEMELQANWKEVLRLLDVKKQRRAKDGKESIRELMSMDSVLVESQMQWVKYRETYCMYYELFYSGGSMRPMITHAIKSHLTSQRLEMLKILVDELDR